MAPLMGMLVIGRIIEFHSTEFLLLGPPESQTGEVCCVLQRLEQQSAPVAHLAPTRPQSAAAPEPALAPVPVLAPAASSRRYPCTLIASRARAERVFYFRCARVRASDA